MNEESVFHAALARSSPAERAAFLDGACAEKPELRAAVDALLAAHDDSEPFLDQPVDLDATIGSDSGASEADGRRQEAAFPETSPPEVAITSEYQSPAEPNALIAGRYTLQEKIGEGGMGEVWVAKQSQPVKRKVALKLIKPGMDSRAVLQRFEQERQALAMMDHPNIARVLDGGLTPSSQPFFVMELVNGLPLNKFCDEARLSPRERLELFVPICQAVQHAHQKGIVHRDLKPANILVTLIDGTPVPKVIDFGVAKATGGKLTDESMSTQFGSIVGTLEYMSPEQAGFSGMDVDTRADIYSLGVILYELLTGLRPIDARRLKHAAITEMIRIIREEEPSKPSTRLSTDESLPSMAALRQIEPRRLMALLRGELDWVVMKCLEKHRERRYETANGLAKDIQRYLANEPVEARPASAGYRLSKFLRRNKGAVLAATLVLLAALLGLSAVLAVQARANRSLAAKNRELEDAQAKIQARYHLAVDAIETFHTGVSEDLMLKQPQFKDVRDRLLKAASDFYGQLGALLGKETDLASRRALANANFAVAELMDKIGKKEDALSAHRQVLAARRALAAESPTETEITRGLELSVTTVAVLLRNMGKTQEAELQFRESLTIRQKLADDNPADPGARSSLAGGYHNLANVLNASGRRSEAEAEYRRALAIQQKLADDHPVNTQICLYLAHHRFNLSKLLNDSGKFSEAEAECSKALALYQKLFEDNPAAADRRSDLASGHGLLAQLWQALGKSSQAEAEHRTAIGLLQRLADDNPAVTQFRSDLAASQHNFGDALSDLRRLSEAEVEYRKAIAIHQKLVGDNPAVVAFRERLANHQTALGRVLGRTGKASEADDAFRETLAHRQKLADDNPSILQFQRDLARGLTAFGWRLTMAGRPGDAIGYFKREEAIRGNIAEASSGTPSDTNSLANCQTNAAEALRRLGKLDEALAACNRALKLREPLVAAHPDPNFRADLGESYLRLGQVCCDQGNLDAAADAWKRACELYKAAKTRDEQQEFFFACCHAGLAGLAGPAGSGVSSTEAEDLAEKSVAGLRQAISRGFRDSDAYRTESALDALRSRDDFRALMMDLAFPADAFAG